MRVLLLTQWFDPEPGAIHGVPLARWLRQRGHEVTALIISKLTSRPLVIDLRDPWTGDPYGARGPTALHHYLNRVLERATLRQATKVIVICDDMKRYFHQQYPDLAPDKVVVITNGFDRREFEAATSVDTGGKFTVIYCGALYAHQRPAFTAFCQAWSQACLRNADFRENAQFWAVGRADPEMVQAPAQWPEMNVRFLGYQPRTEAIRHLISANMLLLLIKNLTASADTVVSIPGKTFEYLASGAPILMIGPEGEAANVVRAGGQGTVHNEADIDGMTQSLLRQFHQFRQGKREVGALSAERVRYDRESLTARLGQELDSVVTPNGREVH